MEKKNCRRAATYVERLQILQAVRRDPAEQIAAQIEPGQIADSGERVSVDLMNAIAEQRKTEQRDETGECVPV